MRSFEVGQRFIDYYQNYEHQVLPRGSLIDPSVPMTFVGSAGLTQIESAVERGEDRAGERYVLLQTCFRHFDIEKVGRSPIHLSLFDMAGAFSFGQISREDTLNEIWRFLTGELGLQGKQIWATHFGGGKIDGQDFEADSETFRAWRRTGLSSPQLVDLGPEASFWRQGGGISGKEHFRKCGPTTELFFDRGLQLGCGPVCQPGCQCGRFVEIANVLFIHSQIDQETRRLIPLATPFAETVIGVERLALLLQEKSSVFEIDCLAPLADWVRSCCQTPGPSGWVKSEHVIADHIRALLFLTADGAPAPGKGGQARVMRKLVRGVLTHKRVLGIIEASFIPDLIEVALDLNQEQHPYLHRGRGRLLTYFEQERRRFDNTLSAGYRHLDRIIQGEGSGSLSGEQALDLVKGHGLPFALLQAALARRGIRLNLQEYWEAHARWRRLVAGA